MIYRGTHNDEMCNLYLMYYTDATRGEAFQECGRPAPGSFFSSAPPGYNTVPSLPTSSQPETHSRNRPAPVDTWDPYYDYANQQGYDKDGQSYPQEGSNADYVSPSVEDVGGGGGRGEGGRGGEDRERPQGTPKPVDNIPPADKTSSQVSDADATQAAPIIAPGNGDTVTQPPTSNKMQSFSKLN